MRAIAAQTKNPTAACGWLALAAFVSVSPAAVAQTEDSLARIDAVHIDAIVIEGSSVFSEAELAAMTAPYENRSVSIEELHELRHALSRAYVERGFVSSGVVIPDQRVDDGTIVLRAVEGELADISIAGNERLRSRAIERRIGSVVGRPLDIGDLQASLTALREDPLVERVNAELLPGAALGQSHLRLGITERPPLEIGVTAGNDRSPSVGEHRGTAAFTYRGLIGNGDTLSGRLGFTEGVEDSTLFYHVPVTARGAALDISITDQEADIVEAPFDDIDITSRVRAWSVTASYPLLRREQSRLVGVLGFERKRTESTLLGQPFSFAPGDVDGRARGSAVSIGAEWQRPHTTRPWTLRGTAQIGVDAFESTLRPAGPDSRFLAFLVQFQLAQVLPKGARLLARSVAQIAADPLLAMYKLPVGGRYTVRGYRENLLVRDNALVASLEYQLPVGRETGGRRADTLRVAAFADIGASWDEDAALATSARERIASVGLGVLWDPVQALHIEAYWGRDTKEIGTSRGSLQDRGFHYGLNFNRGF